MFRRPTAGEDTIATLLAEALAAGCELVLTGGAITVKAKTSPPADLMVRLRQRKAELLELLRGERCRHCGELIEYRWPGTLVFADGIGAHLSCVERAEVERVLAVRRRAMANAVDSPDDGKILTREEVGL